MKKDLDGEGADPAPDRSDPAALGEPLGDPALPQGPAPEDNDRAPRRTAAPAQPPRRRSKRLWTALLAGDLVLVLGSGALLGARVFHHWDKQVRPPAGEPAAPSPQAAVPEPSAPETMAPAPSPRAEAKPEAKASAKPDGKTAAEPAAPRQPLGSPATHAPELPSRAGAPKSAPAAKPEAKAPAAKSRRDRSTRPENFSYYDADAKEVHLIGKFLVSQGGSIPMFRDDKGTWSITVYLKLGTDYRYQYQVVDAKGGKRLTAVQERRVE